MAAEQISFRYFRSVEGRAVTRYGTDALIGAERVQTTRGERLSGAASIVWHTNDVVPLPVEWCARYGKELRCHLAQGDLVEVFPDRAGRNEQYSSPDAEEQT